MHTKRILTALVALTLCAIGAVAQTKPVVGVLTTDSPLYSTATISDTKATAWLSAGEPLLITSSQDKKVVLDGVPSLWYQVKTSEAATGWIPGSRMAFTSTAFTRQSFRNLDQYAAYIIMAARPGDRVVAARSFETVAKGDYGYFVSTYDGELPIAVVWERNMSAEPDDAMLPKGFPAALKPYVYFVDFAVVELVGDASVTAFKTLATSIPKNFPEDEGFYADWSDDDFPWYTPPSAMYDDYAYEDEGYYDDSYYEGEESYGLIKLGSAVILGEHEDLNGGSNWADEMAEYVGKKAVVSELSGADSQGFLVVKVKENEYVWRVRNLALSGRGEAGSYGYAVGDRVIIGAHRYIDENNNWADEMSEFVGMEATITSLEGTDDSNCYLVHLDIDEGSWYWRVENMVSAEE
jgi:hypothetical protein